MTRLRSSDELLKHVEVEATMFRKGDTSWVGKVEASRLYAKALAEEHASGEHQDAYEYGKQVVRLRKAVAACKGALTSAESHGVARNETGALADAAARLQAAEAHAAHENTTIYQEELPGHMGSVEGKVVVKPTPPEL